MRRLATICLAAAATICALQQANSQTPRQISYQGVLTDASGNLLPDGTHTLTLRLYTTATGGSAIWSETQSVTVTRGVFNSTLGATTPISTAVTFDRAYFLGVSVDGGAELTPRTALTAAPYALRAATADALAPGASGVVTSVNGLGGAVTLQGGGGTTVTQSGGAILISSTGGGGTGIQGVQSTDGTIGVSNPNGPVANLSLANNAVTTAKLADDAVTSGKIDDFTITSDDLANASVITDRIANATITPAKLNTAGATSGQVLTFNGSAVQWMTPQSGLALPFSATANSTAVAFDITNTGTGGVGRFIQNNSAATAVALDVQSNSGTTIYGLNTGTSQAGYFRINNTGSAAAALYSETNGSGSALQGFSSGSGNGVYGINNGTGRAGFFTNTSVTNSSEALRVVHSGIGRAGSFMIANNASTADALYAETGSTLGGWFGPTAVHGKNTANGGAAIWGEATGTTSGTGIPARGVYGYATAGRGVQGYSNSVVGVFGETDGTGVGVYGYSSGSAQAGYFLINNPLSAAPALYGETNGSGTVALLNQTGTGNLLIMRTLGANVARVDPTGRGFFNGGTQNFGADLAEAFEVEGDRSGYEPGDVLVVSTESDRTVAKSSSAYSTAVVGVYATQPGVILSERHIDADHSDMVPMGVVGVIPTKVTGEGGAIRRGDLLVSSSTEGHAMKADPEKLGFGMVIGKALEDFDGTRGMIKVMVNVK